MFFSTRESSFENIAENLLLKLRKLVTPNQETLLRSFFFSKTVSAKTCLGQLEGKFHFLAKIFLVGVQIVFARTQRKKIEIF